jgi:VWFA-related protein
MKYLIVTGLILSSAFLSNAQSPTPSPVKGDDVVKISTSVIQIDATVTDKKGNVIRDLKPGEVEVYENGKKQEITGFTFVSGAPAVEAGSTPTQTKANLNAPSYLPTGPIKAENVRRTIAVVVDDLSLSFSSVFWVKTALKKYVNEQVRDGDLVAIIRTAGGIGALQQFTTDKRQLLAAVDKLKFSPYSHGGISTFEPIRPSLKEQVAVSKDGVRDLRPDAEAERNAERTYDEARSNTFVSGTLGAVNFIVRGMESLPGRKSIVLLSDGIPLVSRDDSGRPKGTPGIMDRMQRLIDLANRASVVIYTIDPRGLVAPGAQAMDEWTELGFEARLRQREAAFSDSQDGLRYLAYETGGIPFINQNNINRGLEKVMDDQSYYLLAYEPDESTFDPSKSRFNRIEIRVTRPDTRVRYRSGFFGISDERLAVAKPSGAAATISALVSPFAVNDIPLRLHTIFSADQNAHGWLRSYLHIDARQLTFTKAEGNTRKAVFEIVAFSYGDNGMPSDQTTKQFTLTVPEFAYERSLEKGIVYQFAFPVKKAGAYQYRVALRDIATSKVGSAVQFVEVPNYKKDRLVLSGLVLQSVSRSDWEQYTKGTINDDVLAQRTDPQTDTALRQFKQGDVVRFGLDIYNLRSDEAPGLKARMQVFKDGNLHFDGKEIPVKVSRGARSADYIGGIVLGKDMPPGDYLMRVEVKTEKPREQAEYQFVQFEVVE